MKMRKRREGRISAGMEGKARLSLGTALLLHLGDLGLKHGPSHLNPGQK